MFSQTKYPNTIETSGTIGKIKWLNKDNVKTSNDSYATSTSGFISYTLRCTNFGFEIPEGMVIKGIFVEVEAKSDGTISYFRTGQLEKDGNYLGTPTKLYTGYIGDTDTWYGDLSTDYLWDTTWTPEDINDSTFGCNFSTYNGKTFTVSIDAVRVTVYYDYDYLSQTAYCTTATQTNPPYQTGLDWTDLDHIYAEDEDCAYITNSSYRQQTKMINASGFEFDLPDNALIKVVIVQVKSKIDTSEFVTETTTLTDRIFSSEILNDSTSITHSFNWWIESGSTISIDSVSVTVYYELYYLAQVKAPTSKVQEDSPNGKSNWGDLANTPTVGFSNDGEIVQNFSHYLLLTDFGFTIPSNAIIKGIFIQAIIGYTSGNPEEFLPDDASIDEGYILKDEIPSNNIPFHSASIPAGTGYNDINGLIGNLSQTYLYGTNWTPEQINDSNFGYKFSVNCNPWVSSNDSFTVFDFKISVYYELPQATSNSNFAFFF